MSNRRKNRPFGRAWQDAEIGDDGEPVIDATARCARCHRLAEVGEAGDLDVFGCGFCRGRTRFLWSERRGVPVPDVPGLLPDWREAAWRDFWFVGDEFDEMEEMYWEEPDGCYECDDPEEEIELGSQRRFRPFREGTRWFCPRCYQDITDGCEY